MQTSDASLAAHYRYSIDWSPEDQEYVARVTEMPSLTWMDKDRHAALEGLDRLLKETVSDMIRNEEPVPLPMADRTYSGELKVRVSPHKHRELAISAREEGVSLSKYVSGKLSA